MYYIASSCLGDQKQVQAARFDSHLHRRAGNFLPGWAVNHLPKKFSQVSQIFTKESKRNEGHIATT